MSRVLTSQTATSVLVPPIQKGITKRKKQTVGYPNIPSDMCPVPHCEGLPMPDPPAHNFPLYSDEEEENTPEETQQPSASRDLEFFLNVSYSEPHKIMLKELSDLIKDLELSKNKAELLSSG
jgi:hypothetical protein